MWKDNVSPRELNKDKNLVVLPVRSKLVLFSNYSKKEINTSVQILNKIQTHRYNEQKSSFCLFM